MKLECAPWLCSVLWLGLGCAGRFDPAHFEGRSEPRRVEPEALVELSARTEALTVLGTVQAHCTRRSGFRAVHDERLSDLDCSHERLRAVLRESASAAGGQALIAPGCESVPASGAPTSAAELRCQAQVARYRSGPLAELRPLTAPRSNPASRPAPSATEVQRIEQPDFALAFRVSVDFEPRVAGHVGRTRSGAEVQELAIMPFSARSLGDLVARCDGGCDSRALRYSVLIAAGRLGASDVVGLRCFDDHAARRCVGTLAAPEIDEAP